MNAQDEAPLERSPDSCPYCPDQGWYTVQGYYTGLPEQEQCQFCWENSNSVFNKIHGGKA